MVTIHSITGETYFMKRNLFQGYILDEEEGVITLVFASTNIRVTKSEFERIKGELL